VLPTEQPVAAVAGEVLVAVPVLLVLTLPSLAEEVGRVLEDVE